MISKLFANTLRRQVDDMANAWRPLTAQSPPRHGWLRMIRQALGMSSAHLARRLHRHRSLIGQLETGERDGSITLKTLREAAAAMDSDLVYALVPRKPIREILEQRARDIATKTLAPVLHTMDLEAQSPSTEAARQLLEDRVQELLAGNRSRLWDDG